MLFRSVVLFCCANPPTTKLPAVTPNKVTASAVEVIGPTVVTPPALETPVYWPKMATIRSFALHLTVTAVASTVAAQYQISTPVEVALTLGIDTCLV